MRRSALPKARRAAAVSAGPPIAASPARPSASGSLRSSDSSAPLWRSRAWRRWATTCLLKRLKSTGVVLGVGDHGEAGLEVLRQRGLGEFEGAGVAAEAEAVDHGIAGDRVAVRGPHLVEQADGVAHRAGRLAGQQAQGVVVDGDALRLGDLAQLPDEHLHLDAAEVVALAAAADGLLDRAGVGGREDEVDVGRRLLERLEEGVGGLALDFMGLVDQVDLEVGPGVGRAVAGVLTQVPDVVDAAVRCGVHLDEVEVAALVEGDAVGRIGGRLTGVVVAEDDRLGEDAGGGRLAGAAGAGEQVGVDGLVLADGVAQRLDDDILPDDVGEALGAPFEVEGFGGHGRGTPRCCGPAESIWCAGARSNGGAGPR